MDDLVVLVADKNIESAFKGILERPPSLNIREISYKVIPLVSKADPGCYNISHEFLRPYCDKYEHALVVFDRVGSGHEDMPPEEIENQVTHNLGISGWDDRAEAIVINPELENWVWSDSPHVATLLGWDNLTGLTDFLIDRGFLQQAGPKPINPKEAMEAVLREARKPRSSKIYNNLASIVSFNRCNDRAFVRLKEVLQNWFPQ